MKTIIVIPARFGSTRLPGKPLIEISGVRLIDRVMRIAKTACASTDCDFLVATDNQEICAHVSASGEKVVITDENIQSGSDRCLAAVTNAGLNADLVINLQGDVPFTPPEYLLQIMQAAAQTDTDTDIVTLGLCLSWPELDRLREQKQTTPFSGTTCIRSQNGQGLWFSKNIIPAIRKETEMREVSDVSPVIRHIGIYGYRFDALRKYVSEEPSAYEKLEGLEQLRALEAGMSIHIELAASPRISMSGIDTAEDIARAEALINEWGDPYLSGKYI